MLKETPVKVVRINLHCDKCETMMTSDGISLMSYPPQYPYTCPKCGHKITVYEQYPKIEFIDL